MDRDRVRRTLEVVGWLYVLSGVGFAAVSFLPEALAAMIWAVLPGAGGGDGAALMTGVGGGLTAGFGGVMIGLARAPGLELAATLRALTIGLLCWFATDSAASIGHGAWRNALANVVFLAIGLLPVLQLRGAGERPLDGMRAADSASRG